MQSRQDKGWQSMQSILDVEMPVDENKKRLALWWWSGIAMMIALTLTTIFWVQKKEGNIAQKQHSIALVDPDHLDKNNFGQRTIVDKSSNVLFQNNDREEALSSTSKIQGKPTAFSLQNKPYERSQLDIQNIDSPTTSEVNTSHVSTQAEAYNPPIGLFDNDTQDAGSSMAHLQMHQSNEGTLSPVIRIDEIERLSHQLLNGLPVAKVESPELIDLGVARNNPIGLNFFSELSFGSPSQVVAGLGVDINLVNRLKISPHIGFGLGQTTNQEYLDTLPGQFRDVDLGAVNESISSSQYLDREGSFTNYIFGLRLGWQLSPKIRPFLGYTGIYSNRRTTNTLYYWEETPTSNISRTMEFSTIEQSSTSHMLSFGLHYKINTHWYFIGSGNFNLYNNTNTAAELIAGLNPPEGFDLESYSQPEPNQPTRVLIGVGYAF